MTALPRWLLLLTFGCPSAACAGGIYWTNRGQGLLERSSYDGTGRTTVLPSAGANVRGLALDLTNNLIYYADNGADTLYKLNLDGSGDPSIVLVTGNGSNSFPADVRLNLAAGHLYYCDQQRTHIRRINLDGSNPLIVVTDATYQPYYLDLDLGAGKIYWGDFNGISADTGNVFRMNLDGSGRETVVTGNIETRAVCVDPAGQMLYWVNRNASHIMRCKLADLPVSATDATRVQTLYTGLDTPHGMALDVPAGKVYWVDTGTNPGTGLGSQAISRGDMDGRGPHEVLVNLGSEPWDIEVDPRCLSYAEWRARYFVRNPGTAADRTADPDNDGWINALEYALGAHPLRSQPSGWPVHIIHTEKGVRYPAMQFVRRTGTSDLTYLPQHGSDLASWWDETSPTDEIPHLAAVSAVPLEENLELVTVRSVFSIADHPRQFLRLRTVLAP